MKQLTAVLFIRLIKYHFENNKKVNLDTSRKVTKSIKEKTPKYKPEVDLGKHEEDIWILKYKLEALKGLHRTPGLLSKT